MNNTNCLAGMCCPKCGKGGPFDMACRALCRMTDDGCEKVTDIEWADGDTCRCPCGFVGTVSDFRDGCRARICQLARIILDIENADDQRIDDDSRVYRVADGVWVPVMTFISYDELDGV